METGAVELWKRLDELLASVSATN